MAALIGRIRTTEILLKPRTETCVKRRGALADILCAYERQI